MLLLSYNILYGKNLLTILSWIKNLDKTPDIICFQEFPESLFTKTDNEMGGKWNILFAPSLITKEGTYGELTLFKKSLKLVNYINLELGESRLSNMVFRFKSKRSAFITDFSVKNKVFRIANIHLPWFARSRTRRTYLEKIINLQSTKTPTVIVGDYNQSNLLGRKHFARFMQRHNFTMAGTKTTTHRLWKILPQQMDYAFLRKVDEVGFEVKRVKHSDHFPIFLEFEVK